MRGWVHSPASPSTGHISRPQTVEAGSTRQPAESSTSRAFSGGQSTTIESMAHTGRLCHSVPTSLPAISTEDARQLKGDYLKGLYDAQWISPVPTPPPGMRVDVGAACGTRHAARGAEGEGETVTNPVWAPRPCECERESSGCQRGGRLRWGVFTSPRVRRDREREQRARSREVSFLCYIGMQMEPSEDEISRLYYRGCIIETVLSRLYYQGCIIPDLELV